MYKWIVRMKTGEECEITTRIGLDMKAALDNAGLMQCDIEWIRAPHIEIVEDIVAWRTGSN